jgi:hypothetical protein
LLGEVNAALPHLLLRLLHLVFVQLDQRLIPLFSPFVRGGLLVRSLLIHYIIDICCLIILSSVANIELKVSILIIKMSGVRLAKLGRAERYLKLLVVIVVSFALGFDWS